ncbi:hypothetical protein H8356DRAFT_1726373 [Neocallimastix lanati (nom. inval.)]|nr:hypothetical protein H8356DRAFT_1726373 [Neocallimastix sp. JGI-2020a]
MNFVRNQMPPPPNPQRGQQSSVNLQMAEQELDMITNLFNNILDSCHKKCIQTNYSEGDLNKGEQVCIDRCVAKYFDVNTKVGLQLQKMEKVTAKK